MRFVVTSDVHTRTTANNYQSHDRLAQLYQTAYAFADAQNDYNKLDAIFFVGDVTPNGKVAEYTQFFNYVKANTRTGTVAQSPIRFMEQSGDAAIDINQVIGGYHFITLGMDSYNKNANTYFSATKLAWLKVQLDAAVAEDPNKPIFVFQHEPPKSTVIGSYGTNGDVGLKNLLSNYPQVIDFSGHSHRPLSTPRSIWQDTFTAVNTGSLAYLCLPLPDHSSYVNGGPIATDRDSGMFVKGEHERQFAYEAHTACGSRGFVLGVEVTAGNVHDSVAWDTLYDNVTHKHEVQFVTMDAGYKTPWIAKKTLDDGKVPVLPYTRYNGNQDRYKPWEYTYDPVNDTYTCPRGGVLRHTTTDRDGKRTYRSTPKECINCPCKAKCGANEKGQKIYTAHIWQEYLDMVEQIRKTERAKNIYAQRKETIERVFADAKEKHAMRYTHHRGLAAVTRWVRLKYAAMNLKKLANWSWNNSFFSQILLVFTPKYTKTPVFA